MQPEQLEEGEAVADLWLTSPAATHAPSTSVPAYRTSRNSHDQGGRLA